MKAYLESYVKVSHAVISAIVGTVLIGIVGSLSFADDLPQQKIPAKKSAKKTFNHRTLTLADAMAASQNKRHTVEFSKANGEKGLLQQQVFDLARGQSQLQLALVVDGTDSMGQDLSSLKTGLKGFVAALRQKREGLMTEVAVVVYRDFEFDIASPVTIATPDDRDSSRGIFLDASSSELAAAIDSIQTASGAPRFPEQVDRGLHVAINQLKWSEGNTAAKSIILAGDAPPFDQSEMGKINPRYQAALRGYSATELIEAANQRHISIFSILCNAGFAGQNDPELARIAELSRPELNRFAQLLASQTNGKVLDLSDPRMIEELLDDSGELERLTQLKKIEGRDLDHRVQTDIIRVAVLPSVPMNVLRDGTDGWPKTAGYTYACALVNRLSDIDSRGVVNMSPVLWDKFSLVNLRLKSSAPGATDEQFLKELAAADALDLDFILWGDYPDTPGRHEVRLRAFDRNGVEVAKTGIIEGTTLTKLVEPSLVELAAKLGEVTSGKTADHKELLAFSKLLAAPALLRDDEGWNENLLESYRLLEEAAAYEVGHPKAQALNENARQILDSFLQMRANDPFALLLRSNCYRNLGDVKKANDDLSAAYMFRMQADPALALEIDADYLLFVGNDKLAAVCKYEALVSENEQQNRTYCKQALRAKWMLSGLYLGGWGFAEDKSFKDEEAKYLEKARELLLDIMVYWPDSPEAEHYQRYVEPRPVHKPRRQNEKRQVSFRLPAEITPPKNGGRVAMNNYDEDGSVPGT